MQTCQLINPVLGRFLALPWNNCWPYAHILEWRCRTQMKYWRNLIPMCGCCSCLLFSSRCWELSPIQYYFTPCDNLNTHLSIAWLGPHEIWSHRFLGSFGMESIAPGVGNNFSMKDIVKLCKSDSFYTKHLLSSIIVDVIWCFLKIFEVALWDNYLQYFWTKKFEYYKIF